MELTIRNIQYDLDGSYGFKHYSKGRTKQEVLSSLPNELEVTIPREVYGDWVTDDFTGGRRERESGIQEKIEDNQGWLVTGFEYEWMDMTFRFLDSPHNTVVFTKITYLHREHHEDFWRRVKEGQGEVA